MKRFWTKKRIVATCLVIVGAAMVTPRLTCSYDDIREAVIRHFLGDVTKEKTYFIEVNGADPTEEFLARFRGLPWKAKPLSLARVRKSNSAVYDPETKRDSKIYSVDDISWVSPFEVKVLCGWYVSPLGAAGYVLRLRWTFGKWVPVGERGTFIS